MQIVFEYHDVNASLDLENRVKERLDKLGARYDSVIRADVFFKEAQSSTDSTGKICNIRLSLPGPRLFAEANKGSYEAAIAESVIDLETQLRKRKEKSRDY